MVYGSHWYWDWFSKLKVSFTSVNEKKCCDNCFFVAKFITDPPTDPCNRPVDCYREGEMVGDPDDCRKFFKCENYRWTHNTCPPSTYFARYSLRCYNTAEWCVECPVIPSSTLPATTRSTSGGTITNFLLILILYMY